MKILKVKVTYWRPCKKETSTILWDGGSICEIGLMESGKVDDVTAEVWRGGGKDEINKYYLTYSDVLLFISVIKTGFIRFLIT